MPSLRAAEQRLILPVSRAEGVEAEAVPVVTGSPVTCAAPEDQAAGRVGVRAVRPTENLRVHHVRQVAEGGGHVERNLVTLCENCHRAEHRL